MTSEKAIESKTRILNDYSLMDIFKYSDIKDLFRWIRISQQFYECIHRELKLENQLMIADNEELICRTYSYKLLLRVRKNDCQKSDFRVINIESAIIQKSNVYFLNQSLTQLRTISHKLERIQYLTLKNCYLEQSVLQYMEETMNSLKYLLLIDCYFSKSRFDKFCEDIENSTKNVTHLSLLTPMYFIEDNSKVDNALKQTFVSSFKNLKELRIWVNIGSTVRQLFQQLSPKIENLFLFAVISHMHQRPHIPNEINTQLNTFKFKHLEFLNFHLTEETLEAIINSTNLETFGFCCYRLRSRLLIDLAKKHKRLKRLYIFESYFEGYITTNTSFEKVTKFKLLASHINPIQFHQLILSLPLLKTFEYFFNVIICCQNNSDGNCQTCQNLCFDFITFLKSLRKISIDFLSIRNSFLQSINRFPNLNHLWLTNYKGLPIKDLWMTRVIEPQKSSLISYFTQIVEILMEICNENPKKIFKLEFHSELMPFLENLNLPRNLIFINADNTKYFQCRFFIIRN